MKLWTALALVLLLDLVGVLISAWPGETRPSSARPAIAAAPVRAPAGASVLPHRPRPRSPAALPGHPTTLKSPRWDGSRFP
jgi:hypothetical protein